MTLVQFLSTVMASAIGAYVAAAVGFRFAMSKLRKERAFDRRLDWYEKATRDLVDAATSLQWVFEDSTSDGTVNATLRTQARDRLQRLRGLEVEAELYASSEAYDAIRESLGDVLLVGDMALKYNDANPVATPARMLQICYKILFHAASRLAADVRDHLGLEQVNREWRLYDQELRESRAALSAARDSEEARAS